MGTTSEHECLLLSATAMPRTTQPRLAESNMNKQLKLGFKRNSFIGFWPA
jgi:hypothetical protein